MDEEILSQENENPEIPTGEEDNSPAADEQLETPASPEDDTVVTEPQPDKQDGYQKRIDKLTRKAREAERDAAYWKGRAEAIAVPNKADVPAIADQSDPEPTEDSYEDYAAYVKDLAKWAHRQEVATEKAKANQKEEEIRQTKEQERLSSFRQKAKEKFPDFEDVVMRDSDDGGPSISKAMGEIILKSDMGHELAYYLGTHIEESKKISKLDPLDAAVAMGEIKAKLNLKPIKPRITSAPAPIKPIGSEGSMVVDVEKMSFEDYEAYRNRQLYGPNWKKG